MLNFLPTKLMRRTIAPHFLFLFALISLSTATASAQTASVAANRQMELWKTFAPAVGNFKISLPDDPEEVYVPGAESADVTVKIYEATVSGSKYTVSFVKFSKPMINLEQVKKFTEEFAKTAPAGGFMVGETLVVSQKQLSLANKIEAETVLERSGEIIKSKHILTRNAVYLIQLTTPNLYAAPAALKEIYQAESDKFFNSFQILDNKKAK